MKVRIYQRPKNAMQSGKFGTDRWILDFPQTERLRADPLMGWTGSGDTQSQVRLTFPTQAEALEYAKARGLEAEIVPTPPRRMIIQSYADNFR